MSDFHYRWEFDLKSSPEQIWPLVADTNRFNRDTHVPAVETLSTAAGLKNHRRRLRLSSFGIPIEWEEQPFEWVRPKVFGVVRRYSRGPISELRVRVELTPIDDTPDESPSTERKRTKLVYEVWAVPGNLLGRLAIPIQIGLISAMCRGGGATNSLKEIASTVHCPSCNIDFTANFEQSVELTFQPNPSIREIDLELYCVGGPQVTPHIVAQQLLPAGTSRTIDIAFQPGRYRLRTLSSPGWQQLRATNDVSDPVTLRATSSGWLNEELSVATRATINLDNATDDEQLFILERTAWSDDAAMAAEVTALQMFRDLFATEASRPGEQISVGTLTVLFTDLKNSTRMYREIGDATEFGHVMNHFDVLKQVIAEEDGALVKTIGDAVMAVFRQPVSALKAMLHAQRRLASPPDGTQALSLKAGIHTGPCIAVTLNDRLDSFGSTVNLAARLEGQSTGSDIVLSNVVYSDPAVRQFLSDPESNLLASRFEIPLKGFDE